MCHILLSICITFILGIGFVMHTIYTFYLLSCAIITFFMLIYFKSAKTLYLHSELNIQQIYFSKQLKTFVLILYQRYYLPGG